TLYRHALLVEPSLIIDVVFVAMQVGYVGRYLHTLGVDPWALADAVLGVDPTRTLRREIGVPRLATRPGGCGEILAMSVSAGKPAKVAALAEPDTGDEKAHGGLLGLHGQAHTERKKRNGSNRKWSCYFHHF